MHSRIHANLFEKAMAKNKPSQKKPAQKKTQATKTPRKKTVRTKTVRTKTPRKKTLVVRAFQEAPVRPTPAPRVAQPFKKSNTAETERHGPFFKIMKLWRVLHDDGGCTIFTKEELAKRYFPQNETDPEPEEVPYADGEEIDDDDLNYADFPGGDADGIENFIDGDDGPDQGGFSSGDTLAFARLPVKKSRRRKKSHRAGWPSDKQKQDVARYLLALKNEGIEIWNVVRDGDNDIQFDDDEFEKWQEDHLSEERRWRYNPNGAWAKELDHLFNEHGIQGYELVGIMALQELLSAMGGSPQHESTKELIGKMLCHVPENIRQDAKKKAQAWRYSFGNIRKYSTDARKRALAVWHRATIERKQVEIDHRTPGKPLRKRRIVALGTMFDREENSIYFLGSEAEEVDGKPTNRWRLPVQWKFDRIKGVTPLADANPPFNDIFPHKLFGASPIGGPDRLDIERLYSDSAGAFLRYTDPTIRLEMLVHAPGWMAWCKEKPFHPKQVAIDESGEDGQPQLRLVIERCHEREMASRLLRLGRYFTVVSPQSLIERVRADAEAIAQRHG